MGGIAGAGLRVGAGGAALGAGAGGAGGGGGALSQYQLAILHIVIQIAHTSCRAGEGDLDWADHPMEEEEGAEREAEVILPMSVRAGRGELRTVLAVRAMAMEQKGQRAVWPDCCPLSSPSALPLFFFTRREVGMTYFLELRRSS